MGNCMVGGLHPSELEEDRHEHDDKDHQAIKVVKTDGGIMEFYTPITVSTLTEEFPNHGIFKCHDLFWKPLSVHENLVVGKSYYLLPLQGQVVRELGHVRSNSIPNMTTTCRSLTNSNAPYRMSFDYQGMLKRSYTEVFSRYSSNSNNNGSSSNSNNNGSSSKSSNGFWKVKLVISPKQLMEILGQEGRTEELVENVRTVAKCGNRGLESGFGFLISGV